MNERSLADTPTVTPGTGPTSVTYHVDPARSRLSFSAKSFGIVRVHGFMPVVAGTIRLQNGRVQATGASAADRIDTGLRPRDWHLRTAHYLHSAAHPTIQLRVEDGPLAPGELDATLVVRDVAAPIRLTVEAVEQTENTLVVHASTSLDRTPFPGLRPFAGVSRIIHVELNITALAETTR
ncbi:MAG TPA: YceI family protein [Sporichthyaceae bacterium]|jgi:polyisoprenoid-binding protein YceI|nr:YceI family protein [Sporichthyaceae bacterium]